LRNGDILWLGTPGDENSVMIQVSTTGAQEAEAAAPAVAAAAPEPRETARPAVAAACRC